MQNIQEFDIRSCVIDSLREIFDAKLSTAITVSDSASPENVGVDSLRGSVGFSGSVTGYLNVQLPAAFIRRLAATVSQETDGEQKAEGLLAEIGNLLAADLKAALNDAGHPCEISPAVIAAGNEAAASPPEMERVEHFDFCSGPDTIRVEVGLQAGQMSVAGDPSEAMPASEASQQTEKQPSSPGKTPDAAAPASGKAAASEPAPADRDPASAQPAKNGPEDFDLALLLDIPLELSIELGRSSIRIQELLNLAPGAAISLTKLEGEPVDILANDLLIARGQVVVQNEKYGIRITEITNRMDRIRSLS